MYKVFFADDEASMRAGIRNSIDWDNSGFILVGEAPDGELALSQMREMMPDILITDVRMPFMDGIELSSRAKKTFPWIKVIILSGHDEFDYAKQAITIGVEEYLLKPITSERLMETLHNVAARIDNEKKEHESIEKLLNDSRQIQVERLLSSILYGSADLSVARQTAEDLKLALIADYYLVLLIELYVTETKSYNLLQSVCTRAMGALEGWKNAIFFNQGLDRIMCILKGHDTSALEEEAYVCAQAIKYEAERNGDCTISVAIGAIVSDIGDWPKSFADASMAKRYLTLTSRRRIISMQDIRSVGLMPFSEVKKLPTPAKLQYASKADIPRLLEDYFSYFDNLSVTSVMFINYIFMDILIASSKMLQELGGDASKVLSEYANIGKLLTANSGVENAKKMLSDILTRTIEFRDSLTGSKYNDVIAKAQEYICKNFADHDISLHTVAKEVNVSPNHFSTVFSQETGETFINYITKIRLEHAKTLLKTTNMRTSDIGCKVGYTDTHYFSYVFKKNTGITPKEFRK